MCITYSETRKDLPCDQLFRLFREKGWTTGAEDGFILTHFNAPFLHSTLVVSAWDGDTLVGCVRVLSDTVVRAIVEDFAVANAYCGRGSFSHAAMRTTRKRTG